MNLLYIAFKDFSNLHFGANAKVLSQCKAFEEYGYDVDLIGRQGTNTVLIKPNGKVDVIANKNLFINISKVQNLLAKKSQFHAIEKYVSGKKYDACYIRYDFSDSAFIHLLKTVKQHCRKIILELPTYPYEAENSVGLMNKAKMAIDIHYREYMNKYVDRIVTFYAGYNELFGIPVLVVPNGFDFSSMDLVKAELPKDEIHIIAVSSMREWHGYERMIEGLHNYYENDGSENFILHLVGNGREYQKYKNLVEKYHLENRVIMEGAMHGEELDALYEKCALGIDSLARHRSGISVLSSLKSREYGAKGLPMINSCKIDIIEDDFPYLLLVPADESPINMSQIAEFYHTCFSEKNRREVAEMIRDYIESKSSMKNTLREVIKTIQN